MFVREGEMRGDDNLGIRPSRFHYARLKVFYRLLELPVRRLFSILIRIRIEGLEHVPQTGPVLIVANHVGFLDPLVISIAAGRPVQFLATPTMFHKPVLGLVARFFGVIPKKKFHPDFPAIKRLLTWAGMGSAVGIFPEGQRSWDARNLEIVPGIGKLVRRLEAPVVAMRMYNADRISPRWAKKQRRGHVLVHIDEPIRFERTTPPKVVEEEIGRRIWVDPMDCPRAPAYGKDLALGIGNVLFLCPACYAAESLVERRDRVTCRECRTTWLVGSDNSLQRLDTRSRFPLIAAIDRIRTFLDQRNWIFDEDRFRNDGVALESRSMTLLDISGKYPKEIGRGRLQLTKHGLRLAGSTPWALALRDLLVATVDITTDLQFRTRTGLFAAVLEEESVVKWEWSVNHWLARARAADRIS
jgi:1-acyl-sn-glycerol-3-phosphate acyltransferase